MRESTAERRRVSGGTSELLGLLPGVGVGLLLRDVFRWSLFQIIRDLFRARDLSGWLKALWIIALIVAPFLSAIIYLIVWGRGMAERQASAVADARAATDDYIQSVSREAGRPNRLRLRNSF